MRLSEIGLLGLGPLGAAVAAGGEFDVLKWGRASTKAEKFASQLTAGEKANIVTGTFGLEINGCVGTIRPIDRLKFPGLCLQDGPTAMNRADLVSIFPSGLTAAASWDRELLFQRGMYLGREFREKGANVILGPVAGPLGRHALGGRNWEGFSPDPYLTGIAMSQTIRGIQANGVQACAKHLIGNEQETQRSNTFLPNGTEIHAISSNIDDRTLHELYLWPFADAIRAGVSTIMCSYNRLNQTYACENDSLLNKVLREELGFRGYTQSDWFAVHSGSKSINAGLDLNMPGSFDQSTVLTGESYWGANITAYLSEGSVSESRVDEMVKRIMTPYYYLGQDSMDFPSPDPSLKYTYAAYWGHRMPAGSVLSRDVRYDHSSLIRRLAAEATILLKNTDSTLPLKRPGGIGVFGNDAVESLEGPRYRVTPFEIGTVDIGGGSATGQHVYLVSPLEAVRSRAKQIGARVQHIIHNTRIAAGAFDTMWPIPEVCLVFLGTFASESRDRVSFEADWNSTAVVLNVASLCAKTVVILHSAGVNTLPWADHPNVTAILAAHLPGQESGNSIVDVLWGDVDPSGRLPYTIPVNENDCTIPIVNLTTVTSPLSWQANFTEGQFIDYRCFDKSAIEPRFEFGFGLSYTSFELDSPLHIRQLASNLTERPESFKGSFPGGNPALWEEILEIRTRVSNSGPTLGSAVPQLYLSFPQGSVPDETPLSVLRGFEKVRLQPGESKVISFRLKRRDVSYWDVTSQLWRIPAGEFDLNVGFSSRNITLRGKWVFGIGKPALKAEQNDQFALEAEEP